MSLRVLFCLLFVLGFSFYAYRNWFVSLCAAVFLMAFVKHPDMPRGVLGIPGMNLWNLLIVNVIIGWWAQRRQEGRSWDASPSLKVAVFLYFSVVLIAFVRLFVDPSGYYQFYGLGRSDIFVEFFLNSLRFMVPAFLFFDGCRTPAKTKMALSVIVLFYFLLSIQVIRYMGFHPDFSGSELSGRAARIIEKTVGYNRVDMSMMLAGASWAAVAFARLVKKKWLRWGIYGSAFIILFGQALTGGRTGYVTWAAVGLILCLLKWRRLLPIVPVAAVLIVMFIPSVAERMFSGFGGHEGRIVIREDTSEITSGRNLIWPLVISKIEQAPLFGYGRQGMMTTGLAAYARDVLADEFEHPHEAYFEMLLDNGIVGFCCVVPIFFIALKRSAGLFLDRNDPIYEAVGGVALALLLALFIAGLGAQTFYPREGVVGMWAALGVAMRLSEERERQNETEDGDIDEDGDVEFDEPTVDTDGMPYADSGHETMAGI